MLWKSKCFLLLNNGHPDHCYVSLVPIGRLENFAYEPDHHGTDTTQQVPSTRNQFSRTGHALEHSFELSCLLRVQTYLEFLAEHLMGVETELKFRVPTHKLKMLGRWQIPGGKVSERTESDLVSTYFDTGKHKLKHHGLSLRVRQAGNKHIQTIKSGPGAQFGRGEWETEIEA